MITNEYIIKQNGKKISAGSELPNAYDISIHSLENDQFMLVIVTLNWLKCYEGARNRWQSK